MIRSDDLRRSADPHGTVANSNLPTVVTPGGGETAIAAMAAKAQALVQARYEVALHRPRDEDQVRQKLLKECRRPSFAAVAEYNKPVGKGIKGPSIRFAETAIRCMTNIAIETTTVYDDDQKRIVNVLVTDLESNIAYAQDVTIQKTVERSSAKDDDIVLRTRTNSYGKPVHIIVATDEDILNKQNALISKAIRTQGLRQVPGDLIDESMRICRETRLKEDKRDPDAAKRAIYDAFAEQGVNVDQLKLYLGHDAASLTPAELDTLRGLYSALRDGETTWREIMDSRTPPDPKAPTQPQNKKQPEQSTKGQHPLDEQKQAVANMQSESFKEHQAQATVREAAAAVESSAQNEAPAGDQEQSGEGENGGGGDDGRITFVEMTQHITAAKSAKEIDEVIIPMIPEIRNKEQQARLMRMAENKKASLLEQPDESNPPAQKQTQPSRPAQQSTTTQSRARRNVDMD